MSKDNVMPSNIKWYALFEGSEDALDRCVNLPEHFGYNLLVLVRKKYKGESEWEYSRELLLFEGIGKSGKPQYAWLTDWYEGQNQIKYLAIADLDADS